MPVWAIQNRGQSYRGGEEGVPGGAAVTDTGHRWSLTARLASALSRDCPIREA